MIGVSEQAAQTIVTTLSGLIIQVPLGLGEGVCAVAGNCIGANNIALGKRFVNLIAKVTACLALIISVTLFFCSEKIAGLFTRDEDVIEMTSLVFKVVSCLNLLDTA